MIKRQAINIQLISTIDKYKPRTNSRDKGIYDAAYTTDT